MPVSDRAWQIRRQFDALPSRAPKQRAEPPRPRSAAEQIFPSLRVEPAEQERRDNARGHTSPLGGKADNWEQR
jgi:hypothetical protein